MFNGVCEAAFNLGKVRLQQINDHVLVNSLKRGFLKSATVFSIKIFSMGLLTKHMIE